MKVPTRRTALVILLLLLCAAAAWGAGGREDPLRYADRLIAEQQYDEAMVYLADFMKQYPDRFDAAQARIRRITQIRASYNKSAAALIDVLQNDPTNQEKKLAMIRELEALERAPNPAVQDFVAKTKDLALFTYNKAKFEEILAEGRSLIDAGRYVEAASRYETGFELYRPEFLEAGLSEAFVTEAFDSVDSVSRVIASLAPLDAEMGAAFTALADAYAALGSAPPSRSEASSPGGRADAALEANWLRARNAAAALAEARRLVVASGRELESSFAELTAKDETVTENSFLPFAYRLVLGRRTEQRVEGVVGAMDARWTRSLGAAQAALDASLDARLAQANAAFDRGDWDAAEAAFIGAAVAADRGLELASLWVRYAPSDLIERSTNLGQAILALKGEDYLRYAHAASAGRTFASLASLRRTLAEGEAALAAITPDPRTPDAALTAYEARRAAFERAYEAAEALRVESGRTAERMAAWTAAGYGSLPSQLAQGALDGRIEATAALSRSLETRSVALAYGFRFELLAAAADAARRDKETAASLLAGLPSDDPLLPDATFRYPSKALDSLKAADATLAALSSELAVFLASVQARPAYIAADATVRSWAERARALSSTAGADAAESRALAARADEQKRLADSSRLEAERRLAESRAALRANDFERARERLERARERYLASLSFEQSPLLRVESDRLLSELAAAILKTENDLVVADTRRLVTAGKAQYLQGDFDRAESTLLQARSRWSTTNSTPEVEVEYWLKLVQTALSVKTGRDIPVTAPLFPEMSQLLSLAKRYYDEGAAALSARDRPGATRAFAQARQKIAEVKVVFPLNQEARVLELRIDQLSDPDEFGRKFARMVAESRAKLDAKTDLTTAYSDLKDLEAINPRYPGLRAQIERAEILLGFRQPPPDPRAIAEARSLVQAAQRIYDSRQVDQFSFARAQLEKAIGLDPNNEAAGALKDKIATYIGGDTAIVLPSAAETLYGEAVAFFTSGDYINARARLVRLTAIYPKGASMQKVSDLDTRLSARGY